MRPQSRWPHSCCRGGTRCFTRCWTHSNQNSNQSVEHFLSNQSRPLPSIYFPDFIATNHADRADNCLSGTKQEQMDKIRRDIREFKAAHNLDKVVVLWTANTERASE